MARSEFISKRLKEVLLNGKWIANTNIKAQIESVSWEQAIQQVESFNTIAALTFHLNYYLAGIINVFKGGKLEIRDKFSFDLPPIRSESDWISLRDDFLSNAQAFIEHVEKMPDSIFDEPFVDEKYGSYQRNLEGVIEHSYYHMGQISLLKKVILSEVD